MIRYTKGAAPRRLSELAATPGMTWDGLGASDKAPIREALVHDQGGLCAYCQQRITSVDAPKTGRSQMKIEHWHSRDEFPQHQLTWSNLLGVCLGGEDTDSSLPRKQRMHCDAHRGKQKLFLHPVEGQGLNPRDHLQYTKNGKVQSAQSDARIDGDIAALNLNLERLRRAREAVFEALWEPLKRSDFSVSELRKIAQDHQVLPGTLARPYAAFVLYHVTKKLRRKSDTE